MSSQNSLFFPLSFSFEIFGVSDCNYFNSFPISFIFQHSHLLDCNLIQFKESFILWHPTINNTSQTNLPKWNIASPTLHTNSYDSFYRTGGRNKIRNKYISKGENSLLDLPLA